MFRGFQLDPDTVFMYAARIIALLVAIPMHESAHAFVSYKLGDPTAKNLGRISLNPARHFDLYGSLCMLILGFGWAKPVPIDPRYYANRKTGMALSSFAGPFSNLFLAYFTLIVYKIFAYIEFYRGSEAARYIGTLFSYIVIINILLAVFNLLPVPPLDGSRIFLIFLPERLYFRVMRYERYLMIVIMALLWTGLLSAPLAAARQGVLDVLGYLTGYVDAVMTALLAPGAAVAV